MIVILRPNGTRPEDVDAILQGLDDLADASVSLGLSRG